MLKVGADKAQEVCEELARESYFEQLEVKSNRNKTITMKFRILCLDPRGTRHAERTVPAAVVEPDPEDDGREPDFCGDDLT